MKNTIRLQSFATQDQQRVTLALLAALFCLSAFAAIRWQNEFGLWLSAVIGVNLPVAVATVVAGRTFIGAELVASLIGLGLLFLGWWRTAEFGLLTGVVLWIALLGLWLRKCATSSSAGET